LAGGITQEFSQDILDYVFNATALPTISSFYAALTKTDPTDATAGTAVDGAAAPRIQVDGITWTVELVSSDYYQVKNLTDINFTTTDQVTAVEGAEIWNALTLGVRMFWTDNPTASIPSGQVPQIPANNWTISLDATD